VTHDLLVPVRKFRTVMRAEVGPENLAQLPERSRTLIDQVGEDFSHPGVRLLGIVVEKVALSTGRLGIGVLHSTHELEDRSCRRIPVEMF
jgi:hypothetical protein